MTEPRKPEDEARDGGVFGKLPSERPGVRSTRRKGRSAKVDPAKGPEASGGARGQVGEETAPGASERHDPATVSPGVRRTDTSGRSSASPPPTRPETAGQPETPERPDPPEAGDTPGVEDLAWAGITVAAEAATLGVRLLNRAVGAVRKPTDRR
jgi:hypothetical protein